jgi:hypothetical protein
LSTAPPLGAPSPRGLLRTPELAEKTGAVRQRYGPTFGRLEPALDEIRGARPVIRDITTLRLMLTVGLMYGVYQSVLAVSTLLATLDLVPNRADRRPAPAVDRARRRGVGLRPRCALRPDPPPLGGARRAPSKRRPRDLGLARPPRLQPRLVPCLHVLAVRGRAVCSHDDPSDKSAL